MTRWYDDDGAIIVTMAMVRQCAGDSAITWWYDDDGGMTRWWWYNDDKAIFCFVIVIAWSHDHAIDFLHMRCLQENSVRCYFSSGTLTLIIWILDLSLFLKRLFSSCIVVKFHSFITFHIASEVKVLLFYKKGIKETVHECIILQPS